MWIEPLRSLLDFPFYGRAMGRSTKRVAAYLAYVCALFAGLSTFSFYRHAQPLMRQSVDWAAREVPVVRIENGKASAAAKGPVRLQHPALPWLSVWIDTGRSGAVDQKEMAEKNVAVYLTQNMLYVSPVPERLEAYDLSKLSAQGPVVVDADFYRGAATMVARILYPLSFVITWGLSFLWKFSTAFAYALLGLLLDLLLSSHLEQREVFNLAVYAQTPVLFLQGAYLFAPATVSFFPALSFLVGGVYLWQAIKNNAKPSPLSLPEGEGEGE